MVDSHKKKLTPRPKVAAAGIGGAVATVVVFIVAAFGVDIPGGVEAAIATIVSFSAGYFKSEG